MKVGREEWKNVCMVSLYKGKVYGNISANCKRITTLDVPRKSISVIEMSTGEEQG